MDWHCPKCGSGMCWPSRGSYNGNLWCQRCDAELRRKAVAEGAVCGHNYATMSCDECRPKDMVWDPAQKAWVKQEKTI